ncbi:MAG: hypothetical protein EHM39_13500, partial [Chloroflexi bacterium]
MEDTIPVRIIETKGASALVEWDAGDMLRRAYVPKGAVTDGQADATILALGIPYGIDWPALLDLSGVTVETVTAALRRAGIWT